MYVECRNSISFSNRMNNFEQRKRNSLEKSLENATTIRLRLNLSWERGAHLIVIIINGPNINVMLTTET